MPENSRWYLIKGLKVNGESHDTRSVRKKPIKRYMSSRRMHHRSYECEDGGRRAGDGEEWRRPLREARA